jgi:hypothetical protein
MTAVAPSVPHDQQSLLLTVFIVISVLFVVLAVVLGVRFGLLAQQSRSTIILLLVLIFYLLWSFYGVKIIKDFGDFEIAHSDTVDKNISTNDFFFQNDFLTKEIAVNIFVIDLLIFCIAILPEAELIILAGIVMVIYNIVYLIFTLYQQINSYLAVDDFEFVSPTEQTTFQQDRDEIIKKLLIYCGVLMGLFVVAGVFTWLNIYDLVAFIRKFGKKKASAHGDINDLPDLPPRDDDASPPLPRPSVSSPFQKKIKKLVHSQYHQKNGSTFLEDSGK